MTNSKNTKRALFTSVVAILLCCTMLLGTTFAWFTDTATSSGNRIQAGTLDIDLLVYDENSTAADKFDSVAKSTEPIFNYTLWEPGYTQVETMKIANLGNLALKYQLNVIANEVQEGPNGANLAEVIDVYMAFGPQTPTKFADLSDTNVWWKCGTLKELMANPNGFTQGKLLPAGTDADAEGITLGGENGILVGDVTTTIALHMQETAGNEYQNLSLGNVDINLVATQWTYEADSFDNQYDADATYPEYEYNPPVKAEVTLLDDLTVTARDFGANTGEEITLGVGYQFLPSEQYDTAVNSRYKWYHADFVVKADKDVPANSIALAGYYYAWCNLIDNDWIKLTSSEKIPAGTEIRLVANMADGFYVNYEELCLYSFYADYDQETPVPVEPEDLRGFHCGAVDLTGANAGTTMTVELRLYETELPSEENGNSTNVETGKYITVGTFKHTF